MNLKKIAIAVMLGGAVVSFSVANAQELKSSTRVRDIEVSLPDSDHEKTITVNLKNQFKSIEGLVKRTPSDPKAFVDVDVILGAIDNDPAKATLKREQGSPWSSLSVDLGYDGSNYTSAAALVTATESADPAEGGAGFVGLWPIIVRRKIQTGADGTVYLIVADKPTTAGGKTTYVTSVALLEGGPVTIIIKETQEVTFKIDVPFHFYEIVEIVDAITGDLIEYKVNNENLSASVKPDSMFDNEPLIKRANEYRQAESLAKSTK